MKAKTLQQIELARLAPKGERQHDHIKRGQVMGTRDQMERLLGPPHSEGDGSQTTAEWFLVTDMGSAMIYNHWSFNEDEYGIAAGTESAALLTVTHLKTCGLQAYCLNGAL